MCKDTKKSAKHQINWDLFVKTEFTITSYRIHHYFVSDSPSIRIELTITTHRIRHSNYPSAFRTSYPEKHDALQNMNCGQNGHLVICHFRFGKHSFAHYNIKIYFYIIVMILTASVFDFDKWPNDQNDHTAISPLNYNCLIIRWMEPKSSICRIRNWSKSSDKEGDFPRFYPQKAFISTQFLSKKAYIPFDFIKKHVFFPCLFMKVTTYRNHHYFSSN